jgi:hypothetical protein
MKFVSTTALGLALAFGATVTLGTQPAVAKEKAAKPASLKLSKPVREAAAAAQKALAANDTAAAATQLAAGKAAAATPDDNYVLGSIAYDLGRKTNNMAQQG